VDSAAVRAEELEAERRKSAALETQLRELSNKVGQFEAPAERNPRAPQREG